MSTKSEIIAFMQQEFPQSSISILEAKDRGSVVQLDVGDTHLRPGGTVSGPTLMTVADLALYVAIFGVIGIVPLAVTTNLNINFMRKPAADKAIVGVCKLLKIGRSLVVGEVLIYSDGMEDPVAHVMGTYSIPAKSNNS
ncbi:MAG: PaaI family thioesterase [Kangiellaceae bacterium]|nr:PaaI family thioesterase [Kangiellaceae bacterium]